jgi:ribosomal 30S subunit maturation factor RimM
MTNSRKWREHLQIGFQVFTQDGGDEFGAVRDVCPGGKDEILVNIENGGDHCIPLEAIVDVHSEKVIVDVARLPSSVRRAVDRAHQAEQPGL